VYNNTFYLIVSKYYDGQRGGELELWSSPNPKFSDLDRKFMGVVVFDPVHQGVDTPSVITTDISRIGFPNSRFWVYYSKTVHGGSSKIVYPTLLTRASSPAVAIKQAILPTPGRIVLLNGVYNVSIPSTNEGIDLPYGIELDGNNSTIKLSSGTKMNATNTGIIDVDNGSIIRDLKVDGNSAYVTGVQDGVTISKGGFAENVTSFNWNRYGVQCQGVFRDGEIFSNSIGIVVRNGGKVIGSKIYKNKYAGIVYDNGQIIDSEIYSNTRGINDSTAKSLFLASSYTTYRDIAS
jgi:hypothetical protein